MECSDRFIANIYDAIDRIEVLLRSPRSPDRTSPLIDHIASLVLPITIAITHRSRSAIAIDPLGPTTDSSAHS